MPFIIRQVPAPVMRPAFLTHARLRRANLISQFTVAAALEALGDDMASVSNGSLRLGIVMCVMAGSVADSRRFFEETMRDPTTASPLIFPETVFNAAASHLAAYLGCPGINYTIVGDESTFVQGLAIAADWLLAGKCDGCVVIAAEEMDWIVSDAVRLFDRQSIHSDGAGALYLKSEVRSPKSEVELASITDSFPFTKLQTRSGAARRVREQLAADDNQLLCDSDTVHERKLWMDWRGQRISIKPLLGEAFSASAAWQCIVACDSLQRGNFHAANVSVVGANQAAIGARFTKANL